MFSNEATDAAQAFVSQNRGKAASAVRLMKRRVGEVDSTEALLALLSSRMCYTPSNAVLTEMSESLPQAKAVLTSALNHAAAGGRGHDSRSMRKYRQRPGH